MRKSFKTFKGDAVDQSWQAQSIVRTPSAVAAAEAEASKAKGEICATQMLLLQSMMSRKVLLTYQLSEELDKQSSSFLSLYSDVCRDGEGSLPFCPEEEPAAESNTEVPVPEGSLQQRRTGSGGLRFLQEHLRGVPDLQNVGRSRSATQDLIGVSVNADAEEEMTPAMEDLLNELDAREKSQQAIVGGTWSQTLVRTNPVGTVESALEALDLEVEGASSAPKL